jgi:ABC-type uncharacterized transport system substrate-binding protein
MSSQAVIGILMNLAADDPDAPVHVWAFAQGLLDAGWKIGRNVRLHYRWGAGDLGLYNKYAVELVALQPNVILAVGALIVEEVQRANPSVPIVFVNVADPIGSGVAASLIQPGGNATGFTSVDHQQSGKWLEILKEIAPPVTRVGVLRKLTHAAGGAQLAAIEAVAPSFSVEVISLDVRDVGQIERAVTQFAHSPNQGLIVTGSALTAFYVDLLVTLADRHKLPTVYFQRRFIANGGLVSRGPDLVDQFRQAAGYVDRILKGARPADFPVQAPTKYELVINLKTATALGLTVPDTLLARADEVIE